MDKPHPRLPLMSRNAHNNKIGKITTPLMSRNAHDNKIGKITKYRRQFDDFYNFGKYGDCGEFLSNQFHPCWRIWRFWQILVKSPNVCKSVPYLVARQFWQILIKSPNVCKSVPYMVASHVGEYGNFGEFLSNHQMYVNQFHTRWPAIVAKLANMAIWANCCQIAKCM